jgi:inner membrane protein
MDSLTHALLGLTLGALRKPDAPPGTPLAATDRAVLLAAVLAAELPDLDYLDVNTTFSLRSTPRAR